MFSFYFTIKHQLNRVSNKYFTSVMRQFEMVILYSGYPCLVRSCCCCHGLCYTFNLFIVNKKGLNFSCLFLYLSDYESNQMKIS